MQNKAGKERFEDRFEIQDLLGYGSHGKVFNTVDKMNQREVVVKTMENTLKNKSKFMREVAVFKATAGTKAGFPRLFQYEVTKYSYVLVMEKLGLNLKQLKEKASTRVFPLKTVTQIALQTLKNLQVLHNAGFAHRDLKPANIVVG